MSERLQSDYNEYYAGELLEIRNEFGDAINQDILVCATRRLADEIINHGFKNVLFIDSSARPATTALKEYWRFEHPDLEMPGLYFINPFGLKNASDIDEMKFTAILTGKANKSLDSLTPEAARTDEQILGEFKKRYPALLAEKDKPLLIFDTCSHTGTTMLPVKRLLERAGFGDVNTALASEHNHLTADIVLLDEADCYPFGRDTAVLKHQGSVESLRVGGGREQSEEEKLARERATRLRENIKKVIQQACDKEHSKEQ